MGLPNGTVDSFDKSHRYRKSQRQSRRKVSLAACQPPHVLCVFDTNLAYQSRWRPKPTLMPPACSRCTERRLFRQSSDELRRRSRSGMTGRIHVAVLLYVKLIVFSGWTGWQSDSNLCGSDMQFPDRIKRRVRSFIFQASHFAIRSRTHHSSSFHLPSMSEEQEQKLSSSTVEKLAQVPIHPITSCHTLKCPAHVRLDQ